MLSMSSQVNRDLVYCLRILESIAKINLYSAEFETAEKFYNCNSQLNFNAVLNLFAQLGENIRKISKELKAKYTDFPWQLVKSFRNKIVHEYTGIDFDLTFKIIKTKLPDIEIGIYSIINNEISAGSFDTADLAVANDNLFYKNVDFSRLDFTGKSDVDT